MKKSRLLIIFTGLIVSILFCVSFAACDGCSSKQEGSYESSLTLGSYELSIAKGTSQKLYIGYDDKTEILVTSSDSNIVEVSFKDGAATVQGINVGTALIEVSAGSVEKTCKVTVYESKLTVELDRVKSDAKVWVGTDFVINATVKVDGTIKDVEVNWKVTGSCDTTIDGNKLVVKPTSAGHITVIAQYDSVESVFEFDSCNS